jgi:hypothetical protein
MYFCKTRSEFLSTIYIKNPTAWYESTNIFWTSSLTSTPFFIWFVRLLALRPLLAYCASLGWQWRWLWGSRWNVDWQGKPKYSEKTCPSATFSTTNATWLDPGLNPGRRGGKPATNRLSYGAATKHSLVIEYLPRTKSEYQVFGLAYPQPPPPNRT